MSYALDYFDSESKMFEIEYQEILRYEELLTTVKDAKHRGAEDQQVPIYLGYLTGCEKMYSSRPSDWTLGIEEAEEGFFRKILNLIKKILNSIKNMFVGDKNSLESKIAADPKTYIDQRKKIAEQLNTAVEKVKGVTDIPDDKSKISINRATGGYINFILKVHDDKDKVIEMTESVLNPEMSVEGAEQAGKAASEFKDYSGTLTKLYKEADTHGEVVLYNKGITKEGEEFIEIFNSDILDTAFNLIAEQHTKYASLAKKMDDSETNLQKNIDDLKGDAQATALKTNLESVKTLHYTIKTTYKLPTFCVRKLMQFGNKFLKGLNAIINSAKDTGSSENVATESMVLSINERYSYTPYHPKEEDLIYLPNDLDKQYNHLTVLEYNVTNGYTYSNLQAGQEGIMDFFASIFRWIASLFGSGGGGGSSSETKKLKLLAEAMDGLNMNSEYADKSFVQRIKHSLKKGDKIKTRSLIISQLDGDRALERPAIASSLNEIPDSIFEDDSKNDFKMKNSSHYSFDYWIDARMHLRDTFTKVLLKHILEVMATLRKEKSPRFVPKGSRTNVTQVKITSKYAFSDSEADKRAKALIEAIENLDTDGSQEVVAQVENISRILKIGNFDKANTDEISNILKKLESSVFMKKLDDKLALFKPLSSPETIVVKVNRGTPASGLWKHLPHLSAAFSEKILKRISGIHFVKDINAELAKLKNIVANSKDDDQIKASNAALKVLGIAKKTILKLSKFDRQFGMMGKTLRRQFDTALKEATKSAKGD